MGRTKGSKTRCSHCYEEGHNKAGCAELKKEIARDPDGYYARQANRKKMRQKKRVCSYCSTSGHNLATCPTKKSDAVAYSHMNWKYQNAMSAIFRKSGFGVGTIIMRKKYEQEQYFLVTAIDLKQINLANAYSRGLGNDESPDGSQCAPVKLQRIDLNNVEPSDRGRDWIVNPIMPIPRFAHNEIFGADNCTWDNSSLIYQVVAPIKVSSQKMDFDRTSGMAFMTHKDTKSAAHRTINRIKKKIENSEIR